MIFVHSLLHLAIFVLKSISPTKSRQAIVILDLESDNDETAWVISIKYEYII